MLCNIKLGVAMIRRTQVHPFYDFFCESRERGNVIFILQSRIFKLVPPLVDRQYLESVHIYLICLLPSFWYPAEARGREGGREARTK